MWKTRRNLHRLSKLCSRLSKKRGSELVIDGTREFTTNKRSELVDSSTQTENTDSKIDGNTLVDASTNTDSAINDNTPVDATPLISFTCNDNKPSFDPIIFTEELTRRIRRSITGRRSNRMNSSRSDNAYYKPHEYHTVVRRSKEAVRRGGYNAPKIHPKWIQCKMKHD